MKFIVFAGLLVLIAACTPTPVIENFTDCVRAGNPVMESYPRQCTNDGVTYTEELAIPTGATACPDPRPTGATKEYMPVIGSDNERYDNWRLACMQESVAWYIEDQMPERASPEAQTCTQEQKEAEICTLEYRPVCGMVDNGIRCVTTPCPSVDATTFGNGCGACAGQALTYYEGACQDQTFVVCTGEAKTGFDPVTFAKDTGGICVDTCPGNFDEYTTQIGVGVCIEHYSEEDISSWERCERSSDTCNCVKAVETTRSEEIEDAQYRCVPERYAERLLFRSGVDRLDENGEQSVMIA